MQTNKNVRDKKSSLAAFPNSDLRENSEFFFALKIVIVIAGHEYFLRSACDKFHQIIVILWIKNDKVDKEKRGRILRNSLLIIKRREIPQALCGRPSLQAQPGQTRKSYHLWRSLKYHCQKCWQSLKLVLLWEGFLKAA